MKKTALLTLLLYSAFGLAQQANDCVDAIVVCGNSQIASNASGFGTQELDNQNNPCEFEEVNSLWFKLNMGTSGSLAFEITPNDPDLAVDYDFYIYGPNFGCNNFSAPIRCSTTNPLNAGLTYNTTGLSDLALENSEGPGADGDSYVASLNVQAGETYYLLIDRPHGGGGFGLEWTGTAEFNEFPDIDEPNDIALCFANSETEIDLTVNDFIKPAGTDFKIAYFPSLADAFDGTNAILPANAFRPQQAETSIFVKVSGANECFEIKEFKIIADEFLDTSGLEYIQCDQNNDGTESFNLATIGNDITALLSNVNLFNVSIYNSQANADNATNALPLTNYLTQSTTIFARVAKNGTSCYTVIPIALDIITSPLAASLQLVQCDVDVLNSTDGITRFNLEELYNRNPDAANFEIRFFRTLADMDQNRAINNPIGYSNTGSPFSQTIYYQVTRDDASCTSEGEIELVVEPTIASLSPRSPFYLCENSDLSGELLATFDLEEIVTTDYPNLDVSLYRTIEDLTLEQYPMELRPWVTGTETLYARIENANQCEDVQLIELIVVPAPQFDFDTAYDLCIDSEAIEVTGPAGFDTYNWFELQNGEWSEIGNESGQIITKTGEYLMEVGTSFTFDGETSICTKRVDFKVNPSSRATILDIMIENDLETNSIQIEVSGDGDYEYSLDGQFYQDDNVFRGLPPGKSNVYVRDKKGCGVVEEDISLIGYSKFFTPNADGANDRWQIIGAQDLEFETSISIYDRYGKLVSQLRTDDPGWDGMYNGTPLPASDYWFKIPLANGKEFKGHFSLKR